VGSIDEGIEVLTGVKAGARQAEGTFEAGTVNAMVDARLRQMGEAVQRFGKEDSPKSEKPDQNSNAS
jgi:hypothetical protein